tara:strand:+ start:227 stop:682 length:456 start_codon:yes stop_codon:yes gene_type:complete
MSASGTGKEIPARSLARIQKWWSEHARHLLLPPLYPGHQHAWERLDLDTSVCTMCGVPHICKYPANLVPCETCTVHHESVCGISGIVLQDTCMFDSNISVDEFQSDGAVSTVVGLQVRWRRSCSALPYPRWFCQTARILQRGQGSESPLSG